MSCFTWCFQKTPLLDKDYKNYNSLDDLLKNSRKIILKQEITIAKLKNKLIRLEDIVNLYQQQEKARKNVSMSIPEVMDDEFQTQEDFLDQLMGQAQEQDLIGESDLNNIRNKFFSN